MNNSSSLLLKNIGIFEKEQGKVQLSVSWF